MGEDWCTDQTYISPLRPSRVPVPAGSSAIEIIKHGLRSVNVSPRDFASLYRYVRSFFQSARHLRLFLTFVAKRPVDNDVKYWDWEYLLAFISGPGRYPGAREGPSVWRIRDFIERDKIGGYLFVTTYRTNESVLSMIPRSTRLSILLLFYTRRIFESGDPRKALFRAIWDVLPSCPIMSPSKPTGLRDIWEELDLATAGEQRFPCLYSHGIDLIQPQIEQIANARVEQLLPGVEPEISDWDWGDTQTDGEAEESSLTPSQIYSPTYEMQMIRQMEEDDVQDDHSLTEEVSESDIDSDSPSEVRRTRILRLVFLIFNGLSILVR